MADFFVLLNSGDYVLQNDGSSRVLLNSSTGVSTGVIIDGNHSMPLIGSFNPRPAPRIREFELIALGKVTRKITLRATARIIKTLEAMVRARISRTFTESARSKVSKLWENIEAHSFHYMDEKDYEHARDIQERRREAKVKRLRKLFEDYKDSDDEF